MKIFKVLLIICVFPFLVGCGDDLKEPIDHNTFLSTLKGYGYTVNNYTPDFAYADKAYGVSDDHLYIFYLDGKKTNDVEGLFLDECKNAYNEAGTDYKKKTKGGEDWLVLEITSKDKYFYLSMIKDTYIISKGTIENKELIKEMVDKLGY